MVSLGCFILAVLSLPVTTILGGADPLYNAGEDGTNHLYNADEGTNHLVQTVPSFSLSMSSSVPALISSTTVSRLSTARSPLLTSTMKPNSPQTKLPADSKADIDLQKIIIENDPSFAYADVVFTHVYDPEIEETKDDMISEVKDNDIPESSVPKVKVIEKEDVEGELTTVDPVAEILANVFILDIEDYLPKGYQYREEDTEIVSAEDINDDLPVVKMETDNVKNFKPGKLNGKKLAAMSKELAEAELYYSTLAEAELYYSTFGGKKPTVESSGGLKPVEDISNEEVRVKIPLVTNTVRPSHRSTSRPLRPLTSAPKPAPFRATPTPPPVSIFHQVSQLSASLGNKTRQAKPSRRLTSRVITSRPLRSRPLTSAPRSSPASRATTTTTSRPTTPGVCGAFCSLAGTIVIEAGLEWSEELLHSFTEIYKEATGEIVGEMSKVFEKAHFRSAFDFISVEAYEEHEEKVLVDFYAQFSGDVFNNMTTADLKDTLEENVLVGNDKFMMGKFVIDMNSTFFVVVDTTTPLEIISSEIPDEILPDWAWLVVVGGMISTFIISFFGVIMGVQKYRHNQVVKTKVLNPRTLNAFRGQMHFDRVSVDHGTAYANDKRDMWTLQKAQQAEFDKSSRKHFYRSIVSQNDSNAELLGGFDNTSHDDSGGILDNENEEEEHEDKVAVTEVFSRNSNLRVSRGDMLGDW